MWPNCVHAQLQQTKLWPWDQLGNCLIALAIANHKDCHVDHENRSSDAKVVKGQSEDSLSLQLITHRPLPIVLIIEPMMVFVPLVHNPK